MQKRAKSIRPEATVNKPEKSQRANRVSAPEQPAEKGENIEDQNLQRYRRGGTKRRAQPRSRVNRADQPDGGYQKKQYS